MERKAVSGVKLTLLLIGALGSVFLVDSAVAGGTIYIRADGTVEGTNKIQRNGDVYTFTGNIYDEIEVQKSNITIDGHGYTLQGSESGEGFNLTNVYNVTVQNTNIQNFTRGVYLDSSSSSTISGNTITGNFEGIFFYEASNNGIFGNTITNNGEGIWLLSSSDNSIFGNTVTNNSEGIWLVSSSFNSISRNTVAYNGVDGIWFQFVSSNNIIYHNSLIDNANQVDTSNSVNVWDNGCEGNYWSNYTGVDTDGDGIGDTPHIINVDNQDNHPLMCPYLVGDVNHDGTVDIDDLATLGEAYGSQPGNFNWNCHCDITGPVESPERSGLYPPDGVVDIYDLAKLSKRY